jgi:hypothetical protein
MLYVIEKFAPCSENIFGRRGWQVVEAVGASKRQAHKRFDELVKIRDEKYPFSARAPLRLACWRRGAVLRESRVEV